MASSSFTAAQLSALKSELANDPAKLGYAGQSDGACETLGNAPTQSGTIDVVAELVMNTLMVRQVWPAIELLAAHGTPSGASPPTAADKALGAAIALVRLCTATPGQTVKMTDATTNAAVTAQLSALVATATIAQADANAVLALASGQVSRFAAAGIVPNGVFVSHVDINVARASS